MQVYTDKELIISIKSGSKKAYSVFYEQFYDKIRIQILFLTNCEELAEDIAQESFVKLWERRENLDEEQSIKSYVRRIARNMLYDHSRKIRVKNIYDRDISDSELTGDSVTDRINYKDLELTLTRALNHLTPEKQIIFRMSRFEDKTYAEIAKHLGTTPKAVERHMARSLGFIRRYISKYIGIYIAFFIGRFL